MEPRTSVLKKISRRNFLKVSGVSLAAIYTNFWTKTVSAFTSMTMTDFGGIISRKVAGQVLSSHEALGALQEKVRLHPRGTGHSCMGKSMKEGAVIFMPSSQDVHVHSSSVIASAGATLLDIDNAMLPQGRMLPASPDHRSLSLGGVLSVGGYDPNAFKYGCLVDHVKSVDLMDHDGKIHRGVSVGADETAQELCGIGEHNIILSATLSSVEVPQKTLLKKTHFSSSGEYSALVKRFIEENHHQNTDNKSAMDVWYASWYRGESWLISGQSIYKDTVVNEALKEGAFSKDDFRAFRKSKTDSWVFAQPYKYRVWSDHIVSALFIEEQIERALQLKAVAESMGAEVTIYSVIIKANKKHEHFPHYSEDDYVVSVGLYANFLEHQKNEAEEFSQLKLAYSEESQTHLAAKPYRYGWYWQGDFEVSQKSL